MGCNLLARPRASRIEALAKRIWYTALFAGAAAACYLLLRALRVGPAGSTLGALAYVFNAHVVVIGTNPVFLAAMMPLAGLPAVVLATASGRWPLRKGFSSSVPVPRSSGTYTRTRRSYS